MPQATTQRRLILERRPQGTATPQDVVLAAMEECAAFGTVTARATVIATAPMGAAQRRFANAALAARWVDQTGPLGGFDEMATLEDMGVAPKAGSASAADAERCKVPDFAKAMGHEDKWKLHNNCR